MQRRDFLLMLAAATAAATGACSLTDDAVPSSACLLYTSDAADD